MASKVCTISLIGAKMPESSLARLLFEHIDKTNCPVFGTFHRLSEKQKKIAVLTMCGWESTEIAKDFGCHTDTISYHKRVIASKVQKRIGGLNV